MFVVNVRKTDVGQYDRNAVQYEIVEGCGELVRYGVQRYHKKSRDYTNKQTNILEKLPRSLTIFCYLVFLIFISGLSKTDECLVLNMQCV